MSNPAPSPSDRLAESSGRVLVASRGWHPITKLIVLAGMIHLLGDIINVVTTIAKGLQVGYWTGVPLETVAAWLGTFGYSLTFFGTAASVEFLARIWREVVLLRKARS